MGLGEEGGGGGVEGNRREGRGRMWKGKERLVWVWEKAYTRDVLIMWRSRYGVDCSRFVRILLSEKEMVTTKDMGN